MSNDGSPASQTITNLSTQSHEPTQTTIQNPLNSPSFQNSPNATIYNYNYMLPAPSKTPEETRDHSKDTLPSDQNIPLPPSKATEEPPDYNSDVPQSATDKHHTNDFSQSSPPVEKPSLFIQSPDNEFSRELTNRLEEAGLPVASAQTDNSVTLRVENLLIKGPNSDSSGSRLVWTTTATARVLIRKSDNETLNQPFSATTEPASKSPNTATGIAQRQLAEKISAYVDQNRQKFNLPH